MEQSTDRSSDSVDCELYQGKIWQILWRQIVQNGMDRQVATCQLYDQSKSSLPTRLNDDDDDIYDKDNSHLLL